MQKLTLILICCLLINASWSQNKLTPELLWKLNRLSGAKVSPDASTVLYTSTTYDMKSNKGNTDVFTISVNGGDPTKIIDLGNDVSNVIWRPDGKKIAYKSKGQIWEVQPDGASPIKISAVEGGVSTFCYSPDQTKILFYKSVKLDKDIHDKYPNLPNANVKVIDDLMYRHWDRWHDYSYSHVFYAPIENGKVIGNGIDINKDEKFNASSAVWAKQNEAIVYSSKKLKGKEYAESTNSDIYWHDLKRNSVFNLSEGMMGYDRNPKFNNNQTQLAWLSMERNGFESDKNDIILYDLASKTKKNLTQHIQLTISNYIWSTDNNKIFFLSPINATLQVFELSPKTGKYRQITKGMHDYKSISLAGDHLVGLKQSIQYPNDIFKVSIKNGQQTQLTFANKTIYDRLSVGNVTQRMIKTSDSLDMLAWVIYPPNFNPEKKYPTLLYCQGGPQIAVSQSFSYRWNFQLMAANDYIIIAPNRRGLPSFGKDWNDNISGDWGGQAMQDYLSAIDDISKEPYVDTANRGAVGASYGGYSVYFLAGIHEKRFNAFISHCGLYNLESWYATTEEMFFANWDIKGPYWKKPQPLSYAKFSPHKFVDKWDTPTLVIHSELDYRVPISEGIQAFNALQLRGIPSRFLYFEDEGHHILKPQNAIIWQHEFFKWLDQWLKQ